MHKENLKNISNIKKENFSDSTFLSRLLDLHQVPEEINYIGALPETTHDNNGISLPRILTVVGSRAHTNYGKDVVDHLISSLRGQPVIILSGLALGIDGLAHRAALENEIITVAIPGSGLSQKILYPRTHLNLAKEILEKGGAIISELDNEESAAQWTFPARNRLMAALSDAILIIEAENPSGTLITARQALELGKDIGVVTGSIFSKTSEGTHSLLKDGAIPITDAESLLELLHLKPLAGDSEEVQINLNENEKLLYSLIKEPIQKDSLLIESGLTPTDFMITITQLEMKKLIRDTFGEVRRVQ